MGQLFRILFRHIPFLRPILRPLMRILVGMLAIPLFRLFLKRVVRLQELDEELEKDLEQWFRASLVLLASTANMESSLFGWVDDLVLWFQSGNLEAVAGTVSAEAADPGVTLNNPVLLGFRILLAIGVIEAMPDQELFSVIHPGPPKLTWSRKRPLRPQIREQIWPFCRGVVCQHLSRSSPVFAILAAIFPGTVGWFCFTVAIIQYLIIGLVTSRDKALDVLSEFDRQVALRRRELVEEFDLDKPAGDKSAEGNAESQPASGTAATAGAVNGPAADPLDAESPAAIVAKQSKAGYESKEEMR